MGGVDPEVGRTSVGNDFEWLSRGTNFDGDKVFGVCNNSKLEPHHRLPSDSASFGLNHVFGQGSSLHRNSASLSEAEMSASES